MKIKRIKVLGGGGTVEMVLTKSHGERGVFQNIFMRNSIAVVIVRDDAKTRVAFNWKKTRLNRHF